jgi:C4-dicarboxylate-specific signal transduction histidine kinase
LPTNRVRMGGAYARAYGSLAAGKPTYPFQCTWLSGSCRKAASATLNASRAAERGCRRRWEARRDGTLGLHARDAFSRIVRDSARASDVIRGMRAFAKKSAPQLARLDIDEVIREVLGLAGGELRRHAVVLHTDLAAGDRPVLGERVQLQQVLLNLIMNGVEAMSGIIERARELMVSSTLADPGGHLWASSREPQGASICFTIPIESAQ